MKRYIAVGCYVGVSILIGAASASAQSWGRPRVPSAGVCFLRGHRLRRALLLRRRRLQHGARLRRRRRRDFLDSRVRKRGSHRVSRQQLPRCPRGVSTPTSSDLRASGFERPGDVIPRGDPRILTGGTGNPGGSTAGRGRAGLGSSSASLRRARASTSTSISAAATSVSVSESRRPGCQAAPTTKFRRSASSGTAKSPCIATATSGERRGASMPMSPISTAWGSTTASRRLVVGRRRSGGGFGAGASDGGLEIFADMDFRGRKPTLAGSTPDVGAVGMGSTISSLRVPSGGRWQVCTEPNYRGRCQVVSSDVSDLRRGDWNDIIASARRLH